MLWASREEEAGAPGHAWAWSRVPGILGLMLPFFSPMCSVTLCFWKGRS